MALLRLNETAGASFFSSSSLRLLIVAFASCIGTLVVVMVVESGGGGSRLQMEGLESSEVGGDNVQGLLVKLSATLETMSSSCHTRLEHANKRVIEVAKDLEKTAALFSRSSNMGRGTEEEKRSSGRATCHRLPDWSEICSYENICIHGDQIVMVSDTDPMGTYFKSDTTLGDFSSEPVHANPKALTLPYMSHLQGYVLPTTLLKETLPNRSITWMNGSLWIIRPDTDQVNIFHWAFGLLPLWTAQLMDHPKLPPMDNLGILRSNPSTGPELNQWMKGMLNLVKQPDTTVLWQDYFENYTRNHLVCARKAVILGANMRLLPGPWHANTFRLHAYKRYQIKDQYPPPRKITVLDRGTNYPRWGKNTAELKSVLEKLDASVQVVDMNWLNFEDQIRLMANTGILIAVRGAGLTNALFLPRHAVVIEVFPYHYKDLRFQHFLQSIGVQYHSVRAWTPPDRIPDTFDGFDAFCVKPTTFETMSRAECIHPYKNAFVHLPVKDILRVLIDAFDSLGFSLPVSVEELLA